MTKPLDTRKYLRRLAAEGGDLLAQLDRIYPAAPPSLDDTDREVWFKAGQRSVVEFLLTLQRESREKTNVLED